MSVIAISLAGTFVILLAVWHYYGFGRGIVGGLYWLANRMVAVACAADHARVVYHKRMAAPETMTEEFRIKEIRARGQRLPSWPPPPDLTHHGPTLR